MRHSAAPIGREARWALVATCVAVFAIAIDFTAPTVALPSIERDLDTDLSTVQWVLNAYSLTLSVLIVIAGRLADLHGRRRLFFIGAVGFAVASLAATLAPGIGVLLTARVVMATGAALMWPAVLGMTFQALPKARRALAGGLVIGVAGVGNAVGPLIGGALTEATSWRLVFAVNIPMALLAIWLTKRYVHQPFTPDPDAHLDPVGVALLAGALVALLLALDVAADGDLVRPISLALLALFVALAVAFVVVERRVGERALVSRGVMGDRTFRATCTAGLFMSIPLYAVMLFLPQYFAKVQGYDALTAGLALLPLMVSFALTSFVAAANIDRVDRWLLASLGAVAQCVGIFMLSFLDQTDTYVSALGGMVVLGIGIGLFNSVATAAAVTSLDESRASLGGAVLYMFQVAGGTVGLALTTAVFALVSHRSMQSHVDQLGGQATAQQLRDLQGVLVGTESSRAVQLVLPSDAATEVAVVTAAFDEGLQWAFRLDALLVLVGVGVTTHMARSQRRAVRRDVDGQRGVLTRLRVRGAPLRGRG